MFLAGRVKVIRDCTLSGICSYPYPLCADHPPFGKHDAYRKYESGLPMLRGLKIHMNRLAEVVMAIEILRSPDANNAATDLPGGAE